MDFTFTAEQALLRDMLRAFLSEHYGFERRLAAARSPEGWRPEIWRAFAADLGLLGAAVPEAKGGLGGSAVEHMVIMEELGRALVIEPYLETAVIGAGMLARSGGDRAEHELAALLSGETLFAFAWAEPTMRYAPADIALRAWRQGSGWRLDGVKSVVSAAPWASRLIVLARTGGAPGESKGLSLFLLEADAKGVSSWDYPTIDGRRAADLRLDSVAAPADALLGVEGEALPLVEEILDRAIAAICAEAVGAMARMHHDTLQYLQQRRQFGQPLAHFQVLQHRLVDMFMQIEMAVSATYLATLRLDADPLSRARAASTAKVTVGNACRFVGQNAIQLHGGMGMTDELPVGHYFKRTTMIEGEFGSVDHHLARHAALARIAADPLAARAI
jgi:alkylation response protein AidB-like acyl-CoA dehydrogenase